MMGWEIISLLACRRMESCTEGGRMGLEKGLALVRFRVEADRLFRISSKHLGLHNLMVRQVMRNVFRKIHLNLRTQKWNHRFIK